MIVSKDANGFLLTQGLLLDDAHSFSSELYLTYKLNLFSNILALQSCKVIYVNSSCVISRNWPHVVCLYASTE